jgi:glutamyl-tRNA synthetase/nondiscriminating glutamyl-tRNA synthetase
MPVYNFVVVIDDALMKITHVIRGDDHLSNTPKQVALYEALGWPLPEFAHLSTILGPDRERLSKRHGATSIANFRDMGILPEALINYLALLGWAPSGGTREIFSRQELIGEFSLERVTPSPAVFDREKLYWLNRHYIRESPAERIEKLALPYYTRQLAGELQEEHGGGQPILSYPWPPQAIQWFGGVTRMLVASVDRLEELPERASFIFHYDAARALASEENRAVLAWPNSEPVLSRFTIKILEDESACERRLAAERFKQIMNEVKAETGVKGKELFHPVRIALTGSHSGPEFEKLIPLIEEGSRLPLPHPIASVRERIERFQRARAK